MSRIAFAVTGFTDTIVQADMDLRCFFNGTLDSNYPFPFTPIELTFAEAFAWAWKIKTVEVDYDLTVNGDPLQHYVDTVILGMQVTTPTSERQLICASNYGFGPTGPEEIFPSGGGVSLYSYDTTTQEFQAEPQFTGGGFTNDPSGGVEVIEFDVLGHPVKIYSIANTLTGHLTVTIDSYWEYRDSAGNNPIFDGATGAQLIVPVPVGL